MSTKQVILTVAALGGIGTVQGAAAQAVGQADVMIQSLTVTRTAGPPMVGQQIAKSSVNTSIRGGATLVQLPSNGLAINLVVFSHNDDDAQNVRVRVFFPPETHVVSMPSNCTVPTTDGTTNPYATCALGTFFVGASQTVSLNISLPPSHVVPRVGVFAWADTPDPSTVNNHAVQVAP